jgi:hypothetical protein
MRGREPNNMTITIFCLAIATLMIIEMLIPMLRPPHPKGGRDLIGTLLRLMWLFPILFFWVMYFALAYLMR